MKTGLEIIERMIKMKLRLQRAVNPAERSIKLKGFASIELGRRQRTQKRSGGTLQVSAESIYGLASHLGWLGGCIRSTVAFVGEIVIHACAPILLVHGCRSKAAGLEQLVCDVHEEDE